MSSINSNSMSQRARTTLSSVMLNRWVHALLYVGHSIHATKNCMKVKALLLQRISYIENSLQRGMDHLYKEGLNAKNADIIANCLRTYAAIDRQIATAFFCLRLLSLSYLHRVKEAEMLYRVQSVRPFMEKVCL